MRLLRFSAIYVILLMTVVGLASCDTTRRASRRIRNIVNEHPELLSYDTVRIDTIVPVLVAADSIVIPEFLIDSGEVVVHHTEHGTFRISKLQGRQVKVIYTPDTINMRIREEFAAPKLTIQEEHKTSFAEILQWLVIGIIAILFARLLLMKVK